MHEAFAKRHIVVNYNYIDAIEKDAPVKLESYIPDFGNSLSGTLAGKEMLHRS